MPRKVTITTPENVRIEYELAGIASRGGAATLDLLLQAGIIALLYLARYLISEYGKIPGATWGSAALGIAGFVVSYGYNLFFETVWNGQTPGKRVARMRAVREGGLPIDLPCAAIRNLVRVIDFLPVLYMLGGIVVLISSRNKRLGDFAAGTIVVKERVGWKADLEPARPAIHTATESGRVRNVELVTPEEFGALCRFLDRQAELKEDVREQLAARIAAPLMSKLGIEDDGQHSHAALIAEIHRRCVEERGMR